MIIAVLHSAHPDDDGREIGDNSDRAKSVQPLCCTRGDSVPVGDLCGDGSNEQEPCLGIDQRMVNLQST